jgi:GNAT superfamily N-acetyltransferase
VSASPELLVTRFGPETRDDFFRVHCTAEGTDWCYCVAWWVPDWSSFGERSDAANRALRDDLLDRGEYDGYLLHVDGEPAAWCQCGPRDRLEKLTSQYGLSVAPDTWALSCVTVVPRFRGRGLARELLQGILADLPTRGVARVEAFPKPGERLEPGEAWRGSESLFRTLGFARVRATDAGPVYALEFPDR